MKLYVRRRQEGGHEKGSRLCRNDGKAKMKLR